MENKRYPAKVLLFGEYTVLVGSNALSIPAPRWFGMWAFGEVVDKRLLDVIAFLKTTSIANLDIAAFENDVADGLRFESSIPEGYGLGSSAALTAGIFDKYYEKPETMPIKDTVAILAIIESYFHGLSSGFDPVVSYLNCPIVCSNGEYQKVEFSHDDKAPRLSLIDSGIPRNTEVLVNHFKLRMKNGVFKKEVADELKYAVDMAISHFVSGNWKSFWMHLNAISDFQQFKFNDHSPEAIKKVWNNFRAHEDVAIKLCGAGGGGYYMAFTQSEVDLELFEGMHVEVISE